MTGVWEVWVGEQTPAEFMALSSCATVEQAVREYVDGCLAGDVWGPVEFEGNRARVEAALVREIEGSGVSVCTGFVPRRDW